MAFETIYTSAMRKIAAPVRQGFSDMPGYERLPEAAPGTSYIPRSQQRMTNLGNYLKTKAYDFGNNTLKGLARTVLPGKAYDFAKGIWYDFNDKSPIDTLYDYGEKKIKKPVKDTLRDVLPEKAYNYIANIGRGGLKPAKRVDTLVDALRAKKYVDPNTVEELPFAPGTLAHQQYLEEQAKAKNSKWAPKPETRERKQVLIPDGDRMTSMALQEAKSPRYDKARFVGYSDEQIAQMILENYYKPGLAQVLGNNNIDQYTQVTDDQWNRWKDLQARRILSYQNADPTTLASGKSESAQDAALANYRQRYDLWDKAYQGGTPAIDPNRY